MNALNRPLTEAIELIGMAVDASSQKAWRDTAILISAAQIKLSAAKREARRRRNPPEKVAAFRDAIIETLICMLLGLLLALPFVL